MKSKPPEIWTEERLQRAALDEPARRGGTKDDLIKLKAEFRKAHENNNQASKTSPPVAMPTGGPSLLEQGDRATNVLIARQKKQTNFAAECLDLSQSPNTLIA